MSSRAERNPLAIPNGVNVEINEQFVKVKGKNGLLECSVDSSVEITINDGSVYFKIKHDSKTARSLAGTKRALIKNMIIGVSEGYQRKLELVGVGYRAQVTGNSLTLTAGFSIPVKCEIPHGLIVEVPSQTEVILKGIDKQLVGQEAANNRSKRPPEPYKGKGIRYANEVIKRKEGKKK